MQRSHYFFSYSRKDSDFVKRVATDLKKSGANVWLDQLDIAAGVRWDDSIQRALNEAWGVIVVLSEASANSPNVMDEVSYAMSQGKFVVPLKIENCTIPFRLARLQNIDFSGGYDEGFAQLTKTLNSQQVLQTPDESRNLTNRPSIKTSPSPVKKGLILFAILFVAATILYLVFKDRTSGQNRSVNTDTTAPAEPTVKNEIPAQKGTEPAQTSSEGNTVGSGMAGEVNLFAPENQPQLIAASNDDWKNTIDGKEDWAQLDDGVGQNAVYGFRDDRSATFDAFGMLITGTSDSNIKEFELLYGNDSPLGEFKSIGKFQTQNLKLFKTPYQVFKFSPVTAKYFKFHLISSYYYRHPIIYEFQLFGILK